MQFVGDNALARHQTAASVSPACGALRPQLAALSGLFGQPLRQLGTADPEHLSAISRRCSGCTMTQKPKTMLAINASTATRTSTARTNSPKSSSVTAVGLAVAK